MEHLQVLLVVVPLLAAPVCALLPGRRLPWLFATVVAWAAFAMAVALALRVQASGVLSYAIGGWAAPWGIEYRLDAASALVQLLVAAIAAVVLPYAGRSVAQEIDPARQGGFYAALLLLIAGLLGITATGDAFNVFVFLEISSLSSYTLIAMGRDRRALTAAFRYLIMGTIGATFYLIGVGLLYAMTGTLNMADLAERLPAVADTRTVHTAVAFIVVGLCLKIALFPLHLWLPNAYAYAPSAVAALIAATSTKVAVYVLIRFVYTVLGVDFAFGELSLAAVLIGLAVLGMLTASAVAVTQPDARRMLAYSSVAQVGYMVLGLSLASVAGLTAALLHMMNHAVMKGALFMALGCVAYRLGGNTAVSDLRGLGRSMPWTMAAFVAGGSEPDRRAPHRGLHQQVVPRAGGARAGPVDTRRGDRRELAARGGLHLADRRGGVFQWASPHRRERSAVVAARPHVDPGAGEFLARDRHPGHRRTRYAGRAGAARGRAMNSADALLLCLLVPLLGGAGIVAARSRPNLRESVTLITAASLLGSVLAVLAGYLHGEVPTVVLAEPLPGLPLALRPEPLGLLFAVLASGLWLVTSVYSIGYMRAKRESHQTRYYLCFAIALLGAMGVAFASNLLTLFVFYEVLTLSTYPLVAHAGTPEAVRGARTYLGILLATSIGLFLPAIVWTYSIAGTLEFTPGGLLEGRLGDTGAALLLGLFVLGVGKAAVMPVHRWLPAAMVAPTPVSALLHAVAVVKAGVFTITKVVIYVFGLDFLAGVPAERLARLPRRLHGHRGVGGRAAPGQPEATARLFDHRATLLRGDCRDGADAAGGDRRGDPHRGARPREDHAVLHRRSDLRRRGQDAGVRARRDRPAHAVDDGGLRGRCAEHGGRTAHGRLRLEVVHHRRRVPERPVLRADGADRVHRPERRVLPAGDPPRVLPQRDGGAEVRPRRGALADGGGAGAHGHAHRGVLRVQRAGR
jgi:multicomponent Na+:H+ antiporter subunit D